MIERHIVTRNEQLVGYVGYMTVTDVWFEFVESNPNEAALGASRSCTNPPYVDGTPHTFQMVKVTDGNYTGWPFIYCPTCRCLISPPHDSYDYDEYPAEWLAMAEKETT